MDSGRVPERFEVGFRSWPTVGTIIDIPVCFRRSPDRRRKRTQRVANEGAKLGPLHCVPIVIKGCRSPVDGKGVRRSRVHSDFQVLEARIREMVASASRSIRALPKWRSRLAPGTGARRRAGILAFRSPANADDEKCRRPSRSAIGLTLSERRQSRARRVP